MKTILLLFLALACNGIAQTGGLIPNVTFVNDNGCATINVSLKSDSLELFYKRIKKRDTIANIPAGTYSVHFYSCDSSLHFIQPIEIVAGEFRYFTFYNNARINQNGFNADYFDDYYSDENDTNYSAPFMFVNHSWQFGRGLDYENSSSKLQSNYAFQYAVGADYLLGNSPFALGYDFGLNYRRLNYDNVDFFDSSIVYDAQYFNSLDLTIAGTASIYIK